jgi:hypothetical protein
MRTLVTSITWPAGQDRPCGLSIKRHDAGCPSDALDLPLRGGASASAHATHAPGSDDGEVPARPRRAPVRPSQRLPLSPESRSMRLAVASRRWALLPIGARNWSRDLSRLAVGLEAREMHRVPVVGELPEQHAHRSSIWASIATSQGPPCICLQPAGVRHGPSTTSMAS